MANWEDSTPAQSKTRQRWLSQRPSKNIEDRRGVASPDSAGFRGGTPDLTRPVQLPTPRSAQLDRIVAEMATMQPYAPTKMKKQKRK